jgi:hypothetical protein
MMARSKKTPPVAGKPTTEEKSPVSVVTPGDDPEPVFDVKRSLKNDFDDATPSSKKIKSDPDSVVVFVLTHGFEIVSGCEEIENFRSEWSGFILSSKTFQDQKEAEVYSKSLQPSPPSTPMKSVVDLSYDDKNIAPDSAAKLSEVIASMQERKPSNRINIHYRTNSSSHACVFLIECLNSTGKHQWNVKADILAHPIKIFPSEFNSDPAAQPAVQDDVLAACFYNIRSMILRDSSGGPDAPLQTKWVSPDKSREITYNQYLLASHFVIPVDQFSSFDDEADYIEMKLKTFGAALKKVLLSPLFERLHEANCPKESVWKAMNGLGPKNGGLTFSAYIADAAVHVSRCENLNNHVTKMEADKLMTVLWQERKNGSRPKY